jgi:hypothetical protein
LVPYRHNRRELALDTNQDYELALLRLLSGERGYLIGDPQMQADLRAEIESPNPDLSKFRAYSTTMVSLSPDGTRTVEPPVVRRPGSGGSATIGASPQATAEAPAADGQAAMAERPTLGVPEQASGARASSQLAAAAAPQAGPPPRSAQPAAPPAPPQAAMPSTLAPQPTLSATGGRSIVASGTCRYCTGALPEGRNITFCPHCGQNLTVQNCPACGTELDVGWKFCTTCGRATG